MLTKKAKHLNRVLGSETRLNAIGAKEVDHFIAVRLKEGAARTTIYMEIGTLRGALKLARRRGEYAHAVEAVMPLSFSPQYKPRERALSFAEIGLLLAKLPPTRAAVVAFILATGATYPSEVQYLRREDIDERRGLVFLRGTKRATRRRQVPIVAHARAWLRLASRALPLEPWQNVNRDLEVACKAVGIPKCSPNDLRRTAARLLRARGVEPSLLGAFLGHKDSRMAERVYGRIAPEELQHLLAQRMRGTTRMKGVA